MNLASTTVDEDPIARAEAAFLAPYAQRGTESAGRRHPEPPHPYRGPFQRDRDRIVHSSAFRRLSAKTQVFTGELGDYHRTRLTHTHEVASVSRTLARALRANEDLVEALALAHDLGHPPFGHAGEDVLDECLRAEGGFSHNAQCLRIVELLEQRYPEFPGLNLSHEVLEGQRTRAAKGAPGTRPLVEAQIVEAADSVAYNTHDADDALELGLLGLDELAEQPLWSEAATRVRRRYAGLAGRELKHAVLHELIDWQVSDLLEQSRRRIAEWEVGSAARVREVDVIVEASAEVAERKQAFEAFLYRRVYRHPDVLRSRSAAQDELREMFATLCRRPERLPPDFAARVAVDGLRRTVGDYLAWMTDRHAREAFPRITAP